MTSLRNLTKKEIDTIIKDVKYQKMEVRKILQSKIKVYKLTAAELKKITKIISNLTSSKDVPRYLTDKELDYVTEIIPAPLSCISDISNFNRSKIVNKVRDQISTYKICPRQENLEKIREKIYEKFIRSLCEPGESVGSNGANSIGQMLTQMNLNTFHGTGAEVIDLKTIEELFNISVERVNNSCTVHFKDKFLTKEEIYKNYSQRFKGVTIKDLVLSENIMSEISEEDSIWYHNYEIINNIKIPESKRFLRLHLNIYKCFLYNISIDDVVHIIQRTTKSSEKKNSVFCVPTSTFEGIIDIHADEEFIRKTVESFSKSGKSFKDCKRKYSYSSKSFNDDSETYQKSFIKTPITSSDLVDLTIIFLTEILQSCFKEMKIIGVAGLENISTITLNLITFTKQVKVNNEKDLIKFSESPYKVEPEDLFRLYYIYIDYYALNITGIPSIKFVKFFESVGMKIVEKNFQSDMPYCVVMLPETSDEIFEGKPRFKKVKDTYYDNKEKKYSYLSEDPLKLMNRKLQEETDKLKQNINLLTENQDYDNPNLMKFPEIYRNGHYNYIKAYGKNIFTKLMKNKLVDPKYSTPDNVIDINNYFGIESSRLYLIKEYTSNDDIKKMTHVNIDLLVDFQTTTGYLLSVTSTDLAKHSKSTLSAAAFEQPMLAFQKAGTIGDIDEIDNISSCLMTGKECRNGTGIANVYYEDEYLREDKNKVKIEDVKEITFEDIKQSEILGNCFAPGKYVEEDFAGEEDSDTINPNDFGITKSVLSDQTSSNNYLDDEELDSDLDLDLGEDIEEDEEDEDIFGI